MSETTARRRRAEAYLTQPYVRMLTKAVAEGAIPVLAGTVAHLEIRHDDWCPRLRGGYCDCQPALELRWQPMGVAT